MAPFGAVAVQSVIAERATISGLTLIQRGAAASRFAGNVRDFLDEYLITEEASGTVLFGGREEELDSLDCWLADELAPPRFVLAAPGGRGKSALLVRWVERLAAWNRIGSSGNQWRLVFMPISMRFNTNLPQVFYEAIAARLAEVLGETLDSAHTDPAAYYEDRCRSCLI